MDSLWKYMGLVENDKVGKINTWSPFIVFCAMMGIAAYVGKVPVSQTVLLIASHIAFMLVPGIALVSSLQLRWKSSVSFLSISYFSGYCLCIIAYIVFLMLGLQAYSWVYGGIAFLAAAVVLYRSKDPIVKQYEHDEGLQVSALLAVAFLIAFIAFILANRSALIIGYQNMLFDNAYWFKNSVAATKGYPLPELSVSGLHLYWHIFSNFQIAFLHFATGIEIYDLCFVFSCIWQQFMMIMGTYTLFKENSGLTSAMICCAVALLAFTNGNVALTSVYYLHHFYTCPLAYIEGHSAAMFCFVAFTKNTISQQKRILCFCWILILFACTLGLKAPCSCVLLSGIAMMYLCQFIREKQHGRLSIVIKVVIFVLVFIVVDKLFIVDKGALVSQNSSHTLLFSLTDSLLRSQLGQIIYSYLSDSSLLIKLSAYPITMILYHILANGAVVVTFLIAVFFVIRKRNWQIFFDSQNISLFAMSMSGWALFQFLSHKGFSQVYFLFMSYPFALLWAARILESEDVKICLRKNVCFKRVNILLCLATLCAVYYTINDSRQIFRIDFSDVKIRSTNFEAKSFNSFDVTDDDVRGLRWIRDNLPEDVVIATNKILVGNTLERTFVTSAFSERQVYLEGYTATNLPSQQYVTKRLDILKRFYSGEKSAAADLTKDGVSYAVLFKHLNKYSTVQYSTEQNSTEQTL